MDAGAGPNLTLTPCAQLKNANETFYIDAAPPSFHSPQCFGKLETNFNHQTLEKQIFTRTLNIIIYFIAILYQTGCI